MLLGDLNFFQCSYSFVAREGKGLSSVNASLAQIGKEKNCPNWLFTPPLWSRAENKAEARPFFANSLAGLAGLFFERAQRVLCNGSECLESRLPEGRGAIMRLTEWL
jgi:hypothetical protein